MSKYVILIILFSFSLIVRAVNLVSKDKITLITGDVYVGDIQVKTSELIILKTLDGSKFQFQLTEVKSIEKENLTPNKAFGNGINSDDKSNKTHDEKNINGIVELAAGVVNAKHFISASPSIQLAMIFGSKLLKTQNVFLGLGISYNNTISDSDNLALLPVFLRVQNNFTKNRLSPYVSLDAGYAFTLTSGIEGGAMLKLSTGISYRINYTTNLIVGVFAGINSFKADLSETNHLGTFNYYGQTTLNSFGIKAGLVF